ncbi:Calmodulin [Durusdinium trenchii]|uniref:ubiquitinyl hydrolase 1 n=1 Tax=Durusdinium trenchii TaxID=1381693 RepID=A0ABP0S442_9DINO
MAAAAGQQQQQKRPNIWETGPFCALLADPFVENNGQVPSGGLNTASAVLELLIHESPRLERWKTSPLPQKLAELRELASVEIDDADKCSKFVGVLLEKFRNLAAGDVMFVPGGWLGSTTRAFLVYVVEKLGTGNFKMVVCNAGAGLNYHPSKVADEDPVKIKYQTCLEINDVDSSRFMDSAFWTAAMVQWVKPSEFHRVEVLYDVLFPWLSGDPTMSRTLQTAIDAAAGPDGDERVEWRTAQRSGSSSSWRNLMEAVRFFAMRHYGCTRAEMKEFKTLLKVEILAMALQDLGADDRDAPDADQRTLIRLGCRTAAHAVLKLHGVDARRMGQVNQLIRNVEDQLEQAEAKEKAEEMAQRGEVEDQRPSEEQVYPQAFKATDLLQDDSPFAGIRLNEQDVERYAGLAKDPRTAHVSDILQVPVSRVSTVEQAAAVLVRCEQVCGELNERCKDGSSFSSRIALQLQVAELVRSVFTEVLPVPQPPGTPCIWKEFPTLELQQTCMRLVHKLTLVYANAWQSFDAPTRGFDSERSVVSLTLLAVFDCILRHDRFGLEISAILNEDGGFCVSTTVCVANLTLYRLASTMEVHLPTLAFARSQCMDYFERLQQQCKFTDLFTFRMPTDKIEIKKYGTSVLFLRKLMERYGYELVPRTNPNPPPEIEALMEWMTSPSSQLAQEHPEFGLLRDMACLYKFMATMESRESELQRQRIAPSEYVSWGLSFEDHSMESSTFHTRRSVFGNGLRWEVLNYRGLDLDTADVQVTAFGDRKIFFGEGLVVHSPADISAILNHSGDHRPTEDDILHSDALPNFGDTLSRQESEMLLSYLTVPYLRIPLVLAFFATGDRVTYLFNHELQGLLRAALFDASDWVPNAEEDAIATVPASSPLFQSSLQEVMSPTQGGGGGHRRKVVLGTADGLLLNELRHAPESTLRPLMKMLRSLNDLAEASVYSPDAALSLYLIELAVDVQSFFSFVSVGEAREQEMRTFITGTCRSILKNWLREAIEENDIETSCMVHSYLALVWTNLGTQDLDAENVSELLGSICFVRNWHGFGLGEPSALLGYGSSSDSEDPPEQRLVRFMQAHGVDTGRIAKGSLQKYIGHDRPLYLRIGAKTVRVPTLADDTEGAKKRLLANVPEQKLFNMLQRQRHRLVAFLSGLEANSGSVLSHILTKVVRIALDTKGVTLSMSDDDALAAASDADGNWTTEARGKFLSPDREMTLDVQGAQIMWRNDELKPLPDSMTHFNDFHAIFGKRQLHCGVVANQQHRNWVHVVGTKYDLLLWDEPQDNDQGIEAPKDVTDPADAAGTTGSSGNNPDGTWTCAACTFRNPSTAADATCQVCGSSRAQQLQQARQQRRQQGAGGGGGPGGDQQQEEEDTSPKRIEHLGKLYDRVLNPFDEDNIKGFAENEEEQWVLALILPPLQTHYKDKMPYRLLMPHEKVSDDATTVTLMGCVKTEHEVERETPQRRTFNARPTVEKITTSTWKEFVVYKERRVVHVFNLVSHGRKMYRQLVFSSNARYGFHGLQPSSAMFGACGDLKAILTLEQSLIVTRNQSGFVETFVPSRLLFGVIPSGLLEAYQFWHGADGVLRGEPLDAESMWFGSKSIEVLPDRTILQKPFDKRKSLGVASSVLAGRAAATQRRLLVGGADVAVQGGAAGSAAPAEEREFDQGLIMDLCALGFSPAAARLALSKTEGNSAFAAEWLLDPANMGQIAGADDLVVENRKYRVIHHGTVRVRSQPTQADDSGFISNQTATLGFGQVVQVVQRSGNWVRIVNDRAPTKEAWVLAFHPEHGDILEPLGEDGDEEDDDRDEETSALVAVAAEKAAQAVRAEIEAKKEAAARAKALEEKEEDSRKGTLKLINLLDKPKKGDPLFRLLTVLSNVEDLSHILAWADPDSSELVEIEMPRLKLRVQPRNNRLHLTDQTGWFVCEHNERFRKLLDAHSLLLMNEHKELQFLVPNHTASRPQLKGKPFSTLILCDRGSFAWLQTLDTRYFLYKIHTSMTFLISQELSASIYLVHLKLLQREYKQVFQLAPTCTVDVPFAPDEGFIWNQLEESLDDMHPDAHACRLKLSLAIMYAREHIRPPWEVHAEYDRYLAKLPRVSAYCRLTAEEEFKICRMTSQGTPLIKNRLAGLSVAEGQAIELGAPAPRVGGAPWNKVHSQSLDYYDSHGTTLKRVHFRPQVGESGSFDGFMTELLFDDQVVMDEESGVNRQLGFAFLYQLITTPGDVPNANTTPHALGDLLTRYLHLKLSRWGRESVAEGEVEASNSRHMAQLAALLQVPERPWPPLPTDASSMQQMRDGINLYTDQGRQSQVKLWLDMIDIEFQEVWPSIAAENDPSVRFLPAFKLRDFPNGIHHPILPARIVDTSCDVRRPDGANPEIQEIMRRPLGFLWSKFITTIKSENDPPSEKLPFNLYKHAAAQTSVAKDILKRLEADVKGYAKAFKSQSEPVLVDEGDEALDALIAALEDVQLEDAVVVRDAIAQLEMEANELDDPEFRFALHNTAQHRDRIDFALLTQAILSSEGYMDLTAINPTLSPQVVESLLLRVVPILVRTNRISHANRTVVLTKSLKSALKSDSPGAGFRARQIANSLATSLATERHYVERDASFDPRFLVFEYVFDILLRERQVEIVRSFADDVRFGRSHVQQMIMGAGKTTVVAPLLTLLLADGDTLVTQVMPTSLLEQTRHIMRSRFAAIITKRVFTLEFDRSIADSADAAKAVFDKLDEARQSRSVVVASPDAVKSLFLKFVEHIHSLESVDPDVLNPTSSIRQNKEIIQLRDTMQSRSDMADCIVPIFDMWKEGVLIMDEVDVLLHPLRSELNFPIGLKDPIDLSGFRWDLPIHILSALFAETKLEVSDAEESELLVQIDAKVEEGYREHSLQRNPHLVLLDDNFYRTQLMDLAARWAATWVRRNTHGLPDANALVEYMVVEDLHASKLVKTEFGDRSGDNMKILNLARDWIRILLPHVLAKIDRVSFGILSPIDLANIDQKRTPMSRKLMAVPFVGKDVPSRSSEFAHPDVVIGLTVLGYRYEGLRQTDIRTIVTQLKADFSRQVGPRDQRPATKLFREWLEHASKEDDDQLPVLPLPLFQVNDPKQLQRLYQLLRKEDRVIRYYLRQHVFPACMNFQSIKISACGHELGSNMLFTKRIGFSGTPSNLLPNDLGECLYEPGSDGKIMHVLSSDQVVSLQRKEEWTAKSLLRDVATSTPPIHALIDTGALITGMDNEQVARYLLEFLPTSRFEGVVYLDRADRKMFLQRSSGKSLHLSQCGVDPSRRFTFYDQVHTTGMDIKQSPDARAVVTIGKDMTFRDYAQGSFRMRGIGQGQTVQIYLIPEVEQLIKNELYDVHNNSNVQVKSLDVPAWLLVNSMRMEAIQYSMLSLQELFNAWRKEALKGLLDDTRQHAPNYPGAPDPKPNTERLRRFTDFGDTAQKWMRQCIALFREPVGFTMPEQLPTPQPFHDKVKGLIKENQHFAKSREVKKLVKSIAERVKYTKDLTREDLEAEIVNENEQEQQQQQEEEAEEEQEKVSRYTRDDEQANPWKIAHLNAEPSCEIGEEPFYRMSSFAVRESQPKLSFPPNLLLSDNWFRPRWIGLGDRRLKNVMVVLEWNPKSFATQLSRLIPLLHQHLVSEEGMDANAAAVRALAVSTNPQTDADFAVRARVADRITVSPGADKENPKFFVAIALAEAETLRRVLHTRQAKLTSDFALLSIEDGSCIDATSTFENKETPDKQLSLSCLRFVNCDMHYSGAELELLEESFRDSPIQDRVHFFEDCLRLRRREKYLWGDTPLAKLFTEKSEWHLLDARAKLQQMSISLVQTLKSKKTKIDILAMFSHVDSDNDGNLTPAEMQRFLEDLRLGFSPADIALVVDLIKPDGLELVSWEHFIEAFNIPDDVLARSMQSDDWDMDLEREKGRWQCSNCTYINFASDVACEVCGYGWSGMLHVPSDKWMCDPAYGGCTYFNPENNFYCEVCNKSKPSLQNVRF